MAVSRGDYTRDDLWSGDDVALLFDVVHAHDGSENRRLFERVDDAPIPAVGSPSSISLEGTARTLVGEAVFSFVGLTCLSTVGAAVYPLDELTRWLSTAGMEDVRRVDPAGRLRKHVRAGDELLAQSR